MEGSGLRIFILSLNLFSHLGLISLMFLAGFGAIRFNYRLSFGLVTAIFGLRRGIIDSSLFNVILLCVLFSSLAAVVIEKKFLGNPALSFPIPEKAGEKGLRE